MKIFLDEIDRRLLQLAQDAFPLTEKPFAELGKMLNLKEEEVIFHLRNLKELGIIKYVGPLVNTEKIGLRASALIAMKVPEEKLEHIVKVINGYREVFHNFLRDHEYNVWFTVKASDEVALRRLLEGARAGLRLRRKDFACFAAIIWCCIFLFGYTNCF